MRKLSDLAKSRLQRYRIILQSILYDYNNTLGFTNSKRGLCEILPNYSISDLDTIIIRRLLYEQLPWYRRLTHSVGDGSYWFYNKSMCKSEQCQSITNEQWYEPRIKLIKKLLDRIDKILTDGTT